MRAKIILSTLMLTTALLTANPALANEFKPDDTVTFQISAEEWVTTTTARVTVNVQAAVSGDAAGDARTNMQKAVDKVADTEWRLTNFDRSEDNTGLERWNASFEARLPENALSGLHDKAKDLSKAGMKLSIAEIAFDPTLQEIEAVKATLRAKILADVEQQRATINKALPNRNYRVNNVMFMDNGMFQNMAMMQPRMKTMAMAEIASDSAVAGSAGESMTRAQKMSMNAQITLGALPEVQKAQ